MHYDTAKTNCMTFCVRRFFSSILCVHLITTISMENQNHQSIETNRSAKSTQMHHTHIPYNDWNPSIKHSAQDEAI